MSIAEKLQTIAENERKVYEAGKEAENKAFWASVTGKGAAGREYICSFGGAAWNSTTFKPCYDIKPGNAYYMFRNNRAAIDLAQLAEDMGIVIDFSGNYNFEGTFYDADFTRLPTIDFTKASGMAYIFYYASSLVTIDKMIVHEGLGYNNADAFRCVNLVNIRFEGVIAKTLTLTYCSKLSVDSAKDIIAHLKNYLGTDKEQTYTLKFHETVWTKLEASGAAPNGDTWKDYVQYTLGWKI